MFFKYPVYIVASSAVGGHEEMSSPYASQFDFFHDRDTFGEDTFEKAESELSRIALNFLLSKVGIEPRELSLLISGDLQNQCVASSYGLYTFGVPYLPLYGACSTCTEGLLVASLYLQAVRVAKEGLPLGDQSATGCACFFEVRSVEANGRSRPSPSEAPLTHNFEVGSNGTQPCFADDTKPCFTDSTQPYFVDGVKPYFTDTSNSHLVDFSKSLFAEDTEEVAKADSPMKSKPAHYVGVVTTSHNSVAERQFRTPLEYGAERTPTAQWTATAGGAFLLTEEQNSPYSPSTSPYAVRIVWGRAGKVIDGAISDASNMGAAMAPAARDSIRHFFESTRFTLSDLDAIVTGDLGEVGSALLYDLLLEDRLDITPLHRDCGLCLYDKETQDMHAGASGCGCSASLLSAMVLPKMLSGEWRRVLFLSTGALMSPSSVLQGISILGIAPAVLLESEKILSKEALC